MHETECNHGNHVLLFFMWRMWFMSIGVYWDHNKYSYHHTINIPHTHYTEYIAHYIAYNSLILPLILAQFSSAHQKNVFDLKCVLYYPFILWPVVWCGVRGAFIKP